MKRNFNQKVLKEIFNPDDTIRIIQEPLWVGDKNHKTIYVNEVFEKVTGYKFSEAIGKECWHFFDEESSKTINRNHALREKGKASSYEAKMIAKNGEIIPVLVHGTPTTYGGTFGIFSDMRELKKLEQKEKAPIRNLQCVCMH